MMLIGGLKDILAEKASSAINTLSERTGYVAMPDRLAHPQTADVVTLDIVGYRQVNTFSCAVTAGLMVLHTFRPSASVNNFYNRVNPSPGMGAHSGQLVRALRCCGIGVGERDQLSWKDVHSNITKGYPIITLVKSNDPDILHWIVLYGVGIRPNRVYVAGKGLPLIGRRMYEWKSFLSIWEPKGFGLVCWGK